MHRTALVAVLCALGMAGCVSQADLIATERRLGQQIADQRRQIQTMQREMERLRGDVEGGSRPPDPRVRELEDRVGRLDGVRPGEQPPADGSAPPPPPKNVEGPPPQEVARETPPPPPPAPVEDVWQRDVARDQQAIGATNAPEKAELAPIMDSVARKDCGRAVGQLNSFASQKKDSPLASNALYWAARCYAAKGDKNQAISKFYDVVTKYPRGSKAPAALWEQGNLFIEMGDTPDARLALGKLIKDYPNSEEAGRARKRLTELDR